MTPSLGASKHMNGRQDSAGSSELVPSIPQSCQCMAVAVHSGAAWDRGVWGGGDALLPARDTA